MSEKIRQRDPFSLIHIFYSPWFLKGERHGFRDDLFNAMHVFAVLLMGDSFTQYCIHLASLDKQKQRGLLNEKNSHIFRFKNSAEYFQIPSYLKFRARDPLTELARPLQQKVRNLLNQAMEKARDQPDVNAPAPFAEVKALLGAALQHVTGN